MIPSLSSPTTSHPNDALHTKNTLPAVPKSVLNEIQDTVEQAFKRCGLNEAHNPRGESSSKPTYLATISPLPTDIQNGRGGNSIKSLGNVDFRRVVAQLRPLYVNANPLVKKHVYYKILEGFTQRNRYFVNILPAKRYTKPLATVLSEKKTIQKISQCLREGAPALRASLRAKSGNRPQIRAKRLRAPATPPVHTAETKKTPQPKNHITFAADSANQIPSHTNTLPPKAAQTNATLLHKEPAKDFREQISHPKDYQPTAELSQAQLDDFFSDALVRAMMGDFDSSHTGFF